MVEMIPARKAGLMISAGCLIFRIWCTASMKATRSARVSWARLSMPGRSVSSHSPNRRSPPRRLLMVSGRSTRARSVTNRFMTAAIRGLLLSGGRGRPR